MSDVMRKVWLLVLACSVMLLPLRAYATAPQAPSAPHCIEMSAGAMHHAAHGVTDAYSAHTDEHCNNTAQCSDGCMHCLVCPHGAAVALPVPQSDFPLAQRTGIKPVDHGRMLSTTLSPDLRPPILA